MTAFYKEIHKVFKESQASRLADRKRRAKTKAFTESVRAALLSVASQGEPGCALNANPQAKEDSAKVSTERIDGFLVVEVPAELFQEVTETVAADLKLTNREPRNGMFKVLWADKPADDEEPAEPARN